MIETFIQFSRYFIALLFGSAVAVNFAGMPRTRKNYLVFGSFTVALFLFQIIGLKILGMEMILKIYPIISHLPVVVFIVIYLKKPWLISLTSMFLSFLCCQPPRWIGAVIGKNFENASMYHIGYIVTTIVMYYLLEKYVAKSVRHLMNRSTKSCLLFGSMPAFYYIFDYFATFNLNYIYSETRSTMHFMPFITSAFYFMFVLIYYDEILKQAKTERERDMLEIQFKQAQTEFASLKQIQQNAATYRHDMRHHFNLLQGLASKGSLEEIQAYLKTAQSDMDAITPIRFCDNETVNLILSSYDTKAKQSEIQLSIEAKLPDTLTFSDTELCSLISNALENAVHACENIEDVSNRYIKLRMYSKNNKLCIDIRNTYHSSPNFYQGLPVSKHEGHGLGTKAMAHIVEKHGGVFQFLVKDEWFIFQASA
ncbi:sensor histidine kinase [Acetoanaerobium noterae]|uniref:sensor histidine kinase n=1 Tax=Acetoanaerobium noterae TaxID=745369 RepID=UPI0032215163